MRKWQKRKTKKFAIGRIANVSPRSGELYYMRILLTKIKGPRSYEDIRTINGKVYETYRAACDALGLLEDDREFVNAIEEADNWATGNALRRLFVNMLLSGSVQRPGYIWTACSKILSEDLFYVPISNQNFDGM